MSRLSDKDADTLRLWFQFTVTIYSADEMGIALPSAPLGLMLLVWLRVQPEESASYAALRAACRLEDPSSLSHAASPLIKAGYVTSSASAKDAREKELRLTDRGRNVVGLLLHAAFPP
jgi:DNA-binding transcriptional ArsR family regulator